MPETPEKEEPEASDGQEMTEGGTDPEKYGMSAETEISGGYTERELAEAIRNAEKHIRDLELQKRSAQLQLQQMKNGATDGVVKAAVDGTVKTVGDKENPPVDGSPFLTVSGSEGLYVTGYLSELMLKEIQVGQIIYANSWESGRSFEATIQEISPYPSESSNSWGDGNPNVSYYPYTAYIADTEGLKNGEYVDLTMTATYSEDETAAFISLPKAYVRQENGRSYVLTADENDRLKKQYVETGRTFYGEAVEIKSGLSLEDRIAFPYGKTAKVGIKVKDMSDDGMMYY
jgi:HlyD family secretion protein